MPRFQKTIRYPYSNEDLSIYVDSDALFQEPGGNKRVKSSSVSGHCDRRGGLWPMGLVGFDRLYERRGFRYRISHMLHARAVATEVVMSADVSRDQLALIRIEGMHCHKCEHAIRQALTRHAGVHEVEVDFPSGQASVLYDRGAVTVRQLMESVNEAGYHATGFTQQSADQPTHPGAGTSDN